MATDDLLAEINMLIVRSEKVCQILQAESHPELDMLARSLAVSAKQTRSIIDSGVDNKVLKRIRAGYLQGWQELPELLRSMRGVNAEQLLKEIATLEKPV